MTDKSPEKVSIKTYVTDPSNNNVALVWREVNLESSKVGMGALLSMAKRTMEELK